MEPGSGFRTPCEVRHRLLLLFIRQTGGQTQNVSHRFGGLSFRFAGGVGFPVGTVPKKPFSPGAAVTEASGVPVGKPFRIAEIGKRERFLSLLGYDKPEQVLPRAAPLDPVRNVAFLGNAVQSEYVCVAASFLQFSGHLHGMVAARLIVVLDDYDFGAGSKVPGTREGPFPRAAMVGGGGESERGQRIGVFLAFHHEHLLPGRDSCQKRRQPIGKRVATSQIPDPKTGALGIWTPESKIFWYQPDHLVA